MAEEPLTCSCEDCKYEFSSPEVEPCCKCENSYLNYFEPKTNEATEMTKEKCKEVLQALWRYKDCGYSENEIRKSLEMAIKLLEQEPCEDCVSRQAVFDEIQAAYDTDGITDDANGIDYVDKEELEDFISKLPPVAPTRKKGRGVGMTREELLKEIDRERKWLDGAGYTAYNIDIVFSSLYKNIKVLETGPCEDAISRKALLNMYECLDEESRVYAGQVVRDIKALTPVEPTREWIPCSEELPEEEIKVLVCNENGDIEISMGSYSTELENYFDWYTSGWRFGKVIAWQPLPKGYNAKTESEKKVCNGCHYNDGEVHAECVVCDKAKMEGEE